jgi:hypothetical protein
MDPYIERAALWGDFQHSFAVYLAAAIQPLLRPRYLARLGRRTYVAGPEREQVRELGVHIVEAESANHAITVIEVLSPECKKAGPGRSAYFQQRDKFLAAKANIVEIDLLRQGEHTVRVLNEKLEALRPLHYMYLVAVTHDRRHQTIYPFRLQDPLPDIGVPLANDKEVTLDLQPVFTRCWSEGPYPELLRYDEPPPGTMTAEEVRWCEKQLWEAGFRTGVREL